MVLSSQKPMKLSSYKPYKRVYIFENIGILQIDFFIYILLALNMCNEK